MSIHSLIIDKRLLKALSELGFTTLTEIQEKAIPALCETRKDFIGLAQTGTGKTAAFGIPLISAIDITNFVPQALVLCPTRELCLQITQELMRYAKYIEQIQIVAVYGGTDIRNQIRDLKKGAHIIVGTPGRFLDHISRKTIMLDHVKQVVLDEADQMFDMGFQEDIDTILNGTPKNKKIWLFSATMQPKIEKIAHTYMSNPLQITIGSRNSSAKNIEHFYCTVKRSDIHAAVRRFIDFYPDLLGIIFCGTKKETQEMATALISEGYSADALHGDLSQTQRDFVMKKFKDKQLRILVATDVAARGIDVDGITHVFHCNIPDDIENYTHRSGRTARAGKSGVSIIITSSTRRIPFIEKHIGTTIEHIKVPTGQQICQRQLEHFCHVFTQKPIANEIKEHDEVMHTLHDLSKQDLIERIVSYSCGALLDYYKQTSNINVESYKEGAQKGKIVSRDTVNRLMINIGKMDRMSKDDIITFICRQSSISHSALSKVSLQNTRSFFTTQDEKVAQLIIRSVNNTILKGRRIRVGREV